MMRALKIIWIFGIVMPIHPLMGSEAPSEHINQESTYSRNLYWILSLSSSTKNLSLGANWKYSDFFSSSLTTDFLLTSLTNGFALDEVDGVGISFNQIIGIKLDLSQPHVLPMHSARLSKTFPDLTLGGGLWVTTEFDSLGQIFRSDQTGIYFALLTGVFAGCQFDDIYVSFNWRPFRKTAYSLDGRWDQTPFALGNPILEVDLTYTFPW